MRTHICIFESLQLEGLYGGDLQKDTKVERTQKWGVRRRGSWLCQQVTPYPCECWVLQLHSIRDQTGYSVGTLLAVKR